MVLKNNPNLIGRRLVQQPNGCCFCSVANVLDVKEQDWGPKCARNTNIQIMTNSSDTSCKTRVNITLPVVPIII